MISLGPQADPGRARALYRRRAAHYDAGLRFVRRYHRMARERLDPRPGQSVLDVACGTGVNLPTLSRAVGASGRVVGVDLSPEMLAMARERVAARGLANVILVESPLQDARLAGTFDAILFALTHDVLQTEPALDHALAHAAPHARVVSWGSKAPTRRVPFGDAVVRAIARRYVTTFTGFERPWQRLEERLAQLDVEEFAFGCIYVATGMTRGHEDPAGANSG